ncbi:GatB/YqeY domain-containing protein [bacterium]|nr:GatB/YqeY domain-containing protein [bacterium]MBQ6436519.1 GatB/YqeY domain-containing protein [bacterium]
MDIKDQLLEDMKAAMKAHDMEQLGTIRFLRSAIQNAQIDGAGDDDVSLQKIIASQVKKTKEAIEEFNAAGREDLAKAEQAKIAVMKKYLPAQLSDEELKAIIAKVKGEVTTSNIGQLIGQVMKQVAGRADGARVKELVEETVA